MTPPLAPIGDIGVADLAETVPGITWETAQDWDNAVTETGVVHDSYGDLPGGAVIQLGYSRDDPDLLSFHPMNEDSGSTVIDVSGNSEDGTNNGATRGATGLHNLTTYDFNGDYVDLPTAYIDGLTEFTFCCWIQSDQTGVDSTVWSHDGSNDAGFRYDQEGAGTNNNDAIKAQVYDSNASSNVETDGNIQTTNWQSCVWTYDTSDSPEGEVYLDGNARGDGYANENVTLSPNISRYGYQNGAGGDWDGRIAVPQIYSRKFTPAEAQAFHDTGTQGYLETGTKSAAGQFEPNLSDLVYSLNGQSITLDLIGSPGAAGEETVSQVLDGSTSYSLNWTDSHSDFRVGVSITTNDITVSPTFSSVTLAG